MSLTPTLVDYWRVAKLATPMTSPTMTADSQDFLIREFQAVGSLSHLNEHCVTLLTSSDLELALRPLTTSEVGSQNGFQCNLAIM